MTCTNINNFYWFFSNVYIIKLYSCTLREKGMQFNFFFFFRTKIFKELIAKRANTPFKTSFIDLSRVLRISRKCYCHMTSMSANNRSRRCSQHIPRYGNGYHTRKRKTAIHHWKYALLFYSAGTYQCGSATEGGHEFHRDAWIDHKRNGKKNIDNRVGWFDSSSHESERNESIYSNTSKIHFDYFL